MAVIKTGDTESLVDALYSKIMSAVPATTLVQMATESAIEQVTTLGSKEPVANITNKLISTAKSVTLTETFKGAASLDNALLNGTQKTVLTGTGLNSELSAGTLTGVALNDNTTSTAKGPAYLSTVNNVNALTAKVDLDLNTGALTVGNFSLSQTMKANSSGFILTEGAPAGGSTTAMSLTTKAAFTGNAVYTEGNKLQSTDIRSLTLNVSTSMTDDGRLGSSPVTMSAVDSFALSSKGGLKITTEGVTGSIDSLNFSSKMAGHVPDLNLDNKFENAYQSTSPGNTAAVLSAALSHALMVTRVEAAQTTVFKAEAAVAAAELLADPVALEAALSALNAANQARDEANLQLVDIDTDQIKQDLAVELFKGNDTITVTSLDNSFIHGGGGDDRITGNIGNDDLYGDDGNDTINGGKGYDQLQGGLGNDKLYGGDGVDTLYGNEGNDLLDGGTGNDYLYGGDGNDTLLGGTGNDWLEGESGDDTLDGGAGNDVLLGGDGKDILKGGAGNDILIGGTGQDTLTGGAGLDLFIFERGDSNVDGTGKAIDTLTDFNVNEDTIAFNHLGFDLDSSSVKTLTIGNGAKATYASLLIDANKQFTDSVGSVKAVIGYDGGNAYVFVDTDDVLGADTAIKLVGVKTQAAINAIKLIDIDYTFSQVP